MTNAKPAANTALHPPSAAFDSGRLAVSDLHSVAFFQHGNPKGQAAVYLHGGPGGGSNPEMARFFCPQSYRTILFDQRGCGQSSPHAELRENTTWELAADMEKLRRFLGIKKWLVCGGSWGSALALAYAQTYPDAVAGLLLRGVFTLRREELLWFYQNGANWLYPDLWPDFVAPIPPAERGDMMAAYYRRLTGDDEKTKLQCALAWSRWEAATLSVQPSARRLETFSDARFALAFARIECHYFFHRGFFESDGQLIANAPKLAGIPGKIVQGRHDAVTPAKTAWDLAQQWPGAQLEIIDGAGHAADEPGIAAALRQAADNFAANGDFAKT